MKSKQLIDSVVNGAPVDKVVESIKTEAKSFNWDIGSGIPKMIFIVAKPTRHSELRDISFSTTLADLMLQAKGGLNPGDVIGVYKSQAEADKVAKPLLGR